MGPARQVWRMPACSPCGLELVFSTETSPLPTTIDPSVSLSNQAAIPVPNCTDRGIEGDGDGGLDDCSGGPRDNLRRLLGAILRRGMFIHLGVTTRKVRLTLYSERSRLHQHSHCCRRPCLSCLCRCARSSLCEDGCTSKVRFSSICISTTTTSAHSPSSSPSPPTPRPLRSGT